MKKHKQNAGTHKVAKIIGLSFLAIAAILFSLGAWAFTPGSTKDIEEVASRFIAPDDWVETRYNVHPPQNLCLGDIACPYLNKEWKADSISKDGVYKLVRAAPRKPDLDNDPFCRLDDLNEPSCILELYVDGEQKPYVVSVNVSKQSNDAKVQVLLSVREDYNR